MKTWPCAAFLIFWFTTAQPNPADSLAVSREIDAVKQDISGVKYTVQQQTQIQQAIMDSLMSWYNKQHENHEYLKEQLTSQSDDMDSANVILTDLDRNTRSINQQMQRNSIVSLIMHGFSLVLILFLIVYILVQRQRSLDHLLERTNKLAGQNNEILEKAEALQGIKKSLKEMLENQKKTNKALKKKKKK